MEKINVKRRGSDRSHYGVQAECRKYRDARFQANNRLNRRQKASSYVVSLLSLYVIALSLLPNILILNPYQNQILLACSIVLSVFVIFTSLLDGASHFHRQGELLHDCAREIATICHELKNIDVHSDFQKSETHFRDIQTKYSSSLDGCPVNHDGADYYFVQIRKPHLFGNVYRREWRVFVQIYLWIKMQIALHSWLGPHLVAFMMITLIVWRFVIANALPIGSAH